MKNIHSIKKTLLIDSLYSSINKCRVCGSNSLLNGLMYTCKSQDCLSIHWDVRKLREEHEFLFKKKSFKKNEQLIKDTLKNLLVNAGYSRPKGTNHFSVYVLRLSQSFNKNDMRPKCYVGLSGNYPQERLLNHIRGYQTGKIDTKKYLRSLIYYSEQNYSYKDAKDREKSLRDEFEDEGWEAKGGH